MPTWDQIWSRLSAEERRLAAYEHLVQGEKYPEAVTYSLEVLAVEAKTRPEAVARWSLEKRADRLSRIRPIDPDMVGQMIATFLVKHRAPMLARFLDVAEIPNVNGVVDARTNGPPVPIARLVAAIHAVEAEFPAADAKLYLDALEAQGAIGGSNFAEARREARASGGGGGVAPRAPVSRIALPVPTAPILVPPSSHRGSGFVASRGAISVGRVDPYLADTERLTALDALLTDACVATASKVEGALSPDRLRAVVEEAIRLNANRHRTWFHLGFLDAIEGREPDADTIESSERDRGWYVAGAVRALSRRGDSPAIAKLYDRHLSDGRRLLGDRHEAGAEAALPLFDALCAVGRRADAVVALVPTAVWKGGADFFDRLLKEARVLLAASRAADASPIVGLLSDALDILRRGDERPRAGLVEEVALLRALADRLHGGFERAAETLTPVANLAIPALAAQARSDLGLVACRIRSLAEVRLPASAADLPSTASTLAPGRDAFAKGSVPENPHRARADYALGVFHLASGAVEDARVPLERAVASLLGGDAVAEGHGVLARARLYLGLALAESLDTGRAFEATDHALAGAKALGAETPVYVLARILIALAAQRAELGARAVAALYDVVGDRLLDAAAGSGLLAGHEALRETLVVRSEDPRRSRSARAADALALLRESLACRDVPRATRALANLEDLADDADGRARLLALLEVRSNYDPAWDAAEASDARVRLLEADGRDAEAAALLTAAAHEALSKDLERGLVVAEGVLERIAGYGSAIPDAGLVARVEALRRGFAPETPTVRRPVGRVYVVGGNEVQARYEAWLREEVARRWPDVALDFDFTGWSSNWGRELPVIERRVAEADAIVIMRFIRTMLGRALRELCGRHAKPWGACTGHGRDSLLGAIERAVALLPEKTA